MFGYEEKKTVKKISKNKKRVVKKPNLKKTVGKQIKQKKKGPLRIGDKSFKNPQEVSAYYKAEGEKVKKAMKRFKVDQAEGNLNISKSHFMKILSQKRKLEAISNDLKSHKLVLNKKITEFKSKKSKSEAHKRSVKKFVNKMKSLELASKKILDSKEQLVRKELELIAEMKQMAKKAQRDLDLTNVDVANELAKFESSKESVVMRARDLLSEEVSSLFADDSVLNVLDKDAYDELSMLNTQLAKVHGAKKETLKKIQLLDDSEQSTGKELAQAESKVKELEGKYQSLLKK